MARLLGEGGFATELRPALSRAILELGSALAMEQRLPVPSELSSALQPPISHGWAEALSALRAFVDQPEADWKPVVEILERRLFGKGA